MAHEIKNIRKTIPGWVQNLLWGCAAGRCEFRGCNRPLWKHLLTQRRGNKAEKAHIWSVADDGPRGHDDVDPETIDDVENLMLMCHDCHTEVDAKKHLDLYPAAALRGMKIAHEGRIELVTGIEPSRRSHVLLFGANVGHHSSPLRYEAVTAGMLPHRYPAEDRAIELGLINSAGRDDDADFWTTEVANLRRLAQHRVEERLSRGEVQHLSVFARAPQPLLTALGALLTDILPVDVYPLRREPPGFRFDDSAEEVTFEVSAPRTAQGTPALVFAVSGTVARSRITDALGAPAAIWKVTVSAPNNDLVRSREHLTAFRTAMRPLLDRIKAQHGDDALLHVFPVMPIPLAVELGRVRMPKADMPWRIYDEIPSAGFVPAVEIRGGVLEGVSAREAAE